MYQLSLLSSSVSPEKGQVNQQLAAPVVYLLDVVLPSVPAQTLRSYYARTIPSLTALLETLYSAGNTSSEGTAAIIKSTIGAIESLLLVQDFGAWKSRDEDAVQHVFSGYIVGNGMDPRPKVRKRVLEAVRKILMSPPPSPIGVHPAAEGTATICFHTVRGQFNVGKKKKSKEVGEREVKAVHSLHLLKTIASAVTWPKSSIRELVELLLTLSSENFDDMIRLAALEVFQVIFGQATEDMDIERLQEIIEVHSYSPLLIADGIVR
jgi:ribosomal RNA-processing protein 12